MRLPALTPQPATRTVQRMVEPPTAPARPATFSTPRLAVRPLLIRDAQPFHTVWGDPEVIFWGASPDLAFSAQLLERFTSQRISGVAESGWFAVVRRDNDLFVGDVVLRPAPWDPDVPEVGWHVARAHQGGGYASEAAAGLLEHARLAGLTEVAAVILPDNLPSQRVAARIGMTRGDLMDYAGRPHHLWRRVL